MNKTNFFFLLCIFTPLIFQSSQISSSIYLDNNNINTNITYQNSDKELLQSISKLQKISSFISDSVTEKLISLGEQTNSTIKWKNVINKTDDNNPIFEYYPGQRGMTSIGSSFLRMYENTQNLTYLSIIKKIGNYLKDLSVSTDNGTAWPKSEKNPWNWTGVRYGNAGIIPFLISLDQLNYDSSFYDLTSKAADYLVNIQKSNISNHAWWLTAGDTGFITTDYYYGTAGIVNSLLDAYSLTENKLYLNTAIKGGNWLDSLIEFVDDNGSTGFIPWAVTNDEYFNNMKYTGLLSGQAGIGKVFLKLYNLTSNIKWFDNAKILGNWLIKQNINDTGLFSHPGVPYLTNRGEGAKNLLGLSVGSIGIADFFLDIFEYENSDLWLYEVIRITNKASEKLESTEYGYLFPFEENKFRENEFYTGNFFGSAGFVKYLTRLIKLFNNPDHLNMLEKLLTSLQNITVKYDGLLPIKLGEEYVFTNGEHGLASIIIGLSSVNSIDTKHIGKFNTHFKNALTSLPDPELTFIDPDSTVNIQIYVIVMTIIVLSSIRKITSKKKR